MTLEPSTTTDEERLEMLRGDADMQKLNDRTEVLSILGSLLNGGPGAVALATDSLVTLLDLARRQERITCLEQQMAELEARREVTTETADEDEDSFRGRCARCDDEMTEDCPPLEIETDMESETGVYVCEVCFEGGREWLQKQEWYRDRVLRLSPNPV